MRRQLAIAGCAAALLAPPPPAATAQVAPGAWYTAEDIPRSSVVFTGIRPGTMLITPPRPQGLNPLFSRCTANFVFQNTAGPFDPGPGRQLYLGTAGHCALPGEVIHAVAVAPGSSNPVLVTLGDVVVSSPAGADDFALIEIPMALNDWVSPSTAHWGGPTGVYAGPAGIPVVFTGHSTVFGPGGTPRAGQLTFHGSTDLEMTGPSGGGDSGGPILTTDGLAVGEITGLVGANGVPAWAFHKGKPIGLMLSVGGKSLATCPTATPWPLPGCPPV